MLVFPHWRTEVPGEGCRALHWAPPKQFSHYVARPMTLHSSPPPIEDEDSSGSSSPEHCVASDSNQVGEVTQCEWRGCGAQFPGVARLSAHVSRVHAQPHRDGLFYCGWRSCSRPQRGFNARYKMLVHVRTHTNERPHTCNQCQKSFSRAENLKIHLRSHSGEKPYVCPYEGCGKAYSNSSDRFKHTRTHTIDKPYCCKVPGCNKRYTDPSSLRKHVKTYKHFTPTEIRRDSSDELHSPNMSPTYPVNEISSSYPKLESRTQYIPYHSPPRCTISPTSYSSSPLQVPPMRYPLPMEQVTYLRALEQPMYPLGVPTYEMTYMEYTQMYEHAYRNYYTNGMDYPMLRPNVNDKVFSYNEIQMQEPRLPESRELSRFSPMEVEEKPLNLKCSKRLDFKPIEDLVTRIDLPLDLNPTTKKKTNKWVDNYCVGT